MEIRDRIVELKRFKGRDLVSNEKNYRLHPESQRNAMAGVLEEVGWADAALVRLDEDGNPHLIDGHLRKDIALDADVPCLVLDVTEEEADIILATHDPLAAMAEQDSEKLHELLAGLEIQNEALAEMANGLDDALPDFQPTNEDDQPRLDEKDPMICPHCKKIIP